MENEEQRGIKFSKLLRPNLDFLKNRLEYASNILEYAKK